MSLPLNLTRAFTEGRLVKFTMAHDTTLKVPFGYAWMLLSGVIDHKTGTDSYLFMVNNVIQVWGTRIDTANANGTYPLFHGAPSAETSQFSLILAQFGRKSLNNSYIKFTGDAAAKCKVQLLEWRIL